MAEVSSSGLSLSFLIMGVTAASWRICGIEPFLREKLIMSVINRETAGRQFMMNLNGMASSGHVDIFYSRQGGR